MLSTQRHIYFMNEVDSNDAETMVSVHCRQDCSGMYRQLQLLCHRILVQLAF